MIEKPYYDLLGDTLEIYEAVWDTEQFIADWLGIPEDIMDYVIREYVSWVQYGHDFFVVRDEDENPITSVAALVDYICRLLEQR